MSSGLEDLPVEVLVRDRNLAAQLREMVSHTAPSEHRDLVLDRLGEIVASHDREQRRRAEVARRVLEQCDAPA